MGRCQFGLSIICCEVAGLPSSHGAVQNSHSHTASQKREILAKGDGRIYAIMCLFDANIIIFICVVLEVSADCTRVNTLLDLCLHVANFLHMNVSCSRWCHQNEDYLINSPWAHKSRACFTSWSTKCTLINFTMSSIKEEWEITLWNVNKTVFLLTETLPRQSTFHAVLAKLQT